MGQLSGKIADTTWGTVTNQLDYTEVYLEEKPASLRRALRKARKKGFAKKSSSSYKATRSSYHRSLDV